MLLSTKFLHLYHVAGKQLLCMSLGPFQILFPEGADSPASVIMSRVFNVLHAALPKRYKVVAEDLLYSYYPLLFYIC